MSRIIIEKDIDIPMRDGCVLKADLYRPDGPGPFPAVIYNHGSRPPARTSSR